MSKAFGFKQLDPAKFNIGKHDDNSLRCSALYVKILNSLYNYTNCTMIIL